MSKTTGADRLTRYELVRWDPSSEELTGPLGSLALAAIGLMVGGPSGIPVPLLLAIAAVALVDAAVRWSRVLEEVRPAPGFYEWLISRRS